MPKPGDPIFELLQMGNHRMPGVWRYLFPEEFEWLRLPAERHATCDDCYKVKLGEYRDDCRCCTYFPEVTNYMLGLALKSDSRDAVLPLVQQRLVVPFGLVTTPLRYHQTITAYAGERFGQEKWMVCPFVEPSTFHCGIYPFRNSVCSTFFCSNDHGKAGSNFWGRAQDLVGLVETALAQWCMDEVGLPHENYCSQLDAFSTDVPSMTEPETLAWSEHVHAALWGDWCGKEVEFLEACAELVMERRGDLYEIARLQPGRDALVYEENVRQLIPDEQLHEAPELADENTEHRPIGSSWYKLQLAERQLWELPFQEGPVVLSDAVEIIDNPRDDKWCEASPEPFMVRSHSPKDAKDSQDPKDPKDAKDSKPKIRELFGAAEIDLLRVFEQPRVFGEELFERAELDRVGDARSFLARCLRLGILTEQASDDIT